MRAWAAPAIFSFLAACGGGNNPATPVAPAVTTQPESATVTPGQNATFSVAASGTDPLVYQWLRNGIDVAGAASANLTVNAAAADNGTLYTVVVSNAAGSATSNAAMLTVNTVVAPAIGTEPAAISVTAGSPATFTVVASGSNPLTYQWRRNGIDLAGATSASLTVTAAAGDNGVLYTVVVSNAAGSATSNGATLTVNTVVAPAIGTEPAAASVAAGGPATFTVVASGSDPLAYQWRRNANDIAGATGASYTLAAAAPADNGAVFSVRVSNAGGEVLSADAALTVTAAAVAPVITTQPASQTVNAGQTANFAVVATGSAPLTYQWRRNGSDIAGATGQRYSTGRTVAADNGARFSVVVGNAASITTTSSEAVLTVTSALVAPSIVTQPANASVNVGASATFNVGATGSAPLTYQWRKNGVPIAGADAANYTTPAAVAGDNGARFDVSVSNGAGSIASASATLTVSQEDPAMIALLQLKNCLACHATARKLIGPSWDEVTARYTGQPGAENYLASKIIAGGAGAWGVIPMPSSPHVSDAEARQIAQWLLTRSPTPP